MPLPLSGKVALVAGATRGAGRGIAVALGEAGATVYCTGRSSRNQPGPRPETIEETADRVSAAGGQGIPLRVDHGDSSQVQSLARRVREAHGGLDIMVNDIWGGDELLEMGTPPWQMSLDKARKMLDSALWTHLVNARHLSELLLGRERALWVEVTDGDNFGYRGNLIYDLCKMSVIRLAFGMAKELRPQGVTALAITPGFLRSEAMLELFEVNESNWRDGVAKDPNFIASETPLFVGRAVAALAADPQVARRSGRVFASWTLSREYGFTDVDGTRPDWGEHFARAYGEASLSAEDAAYASWERGPIDIAFPNGFTDS